MTLRQLLARLGIGKVAYRVGVTPRTIRKWDREGPSFRGAKKLGVVTMRHLRSVKSAETRRLRFQDTLPVPVDPYQKIGRPRSGQLSDEEILPSRKPRGHAEYTEVYDSARYHGQHNWVSTGRPVIDVDNDEISDASLAIWQDSGALFCFVEFLFYRYIPFNPAYSGEMIKKQGTWVPWHIQTPVRATLHEISNGIDVVMDEAKDAARSRLLWLEAINVKTLDEKD